MAEAALNIDPPRALAVENLVKSFGAVTILKGVSVDLEPGGFLVLVGPSGCGKSTLLNCIAGLEEATSGKININGRDVTTEPPRDRDIAMVFQSYALYPTMSVAENIGFGMKIRKMPGEVIATKTSEVADLLQIGHLLDRRPSQLSGGQRQRVAMGRALVREPALFLFDEPLSNLDAKLRVEMRAEIKRLHETTQASIVYVTHDQIEAMTLATKIVVLKDGQVMQVGTPEDIYERPANTFVADFMGSPPMNLIPCTAGVGVTLPSGQVVSIAAPVQGAVTLGLRPEHLAMKADGLIEAEVRLVENAGSEAFVTLALGETKIVVRHPGRAHCKPGDQVRLAADPAHFVWFDPETGLRLT
jgi:multiple sugar transport system ATP-binding protein